MKFQIKERVMRKNLKEEDDGQRIKLVDLLPKNNIQGGKGEALFGIPVELELRERKLDSDGSREIQ